MLLAYGRRAAGFALFVENGTAVLDFNLAGEHSLLRAPTPAPPGTSEISLTLTRRDGRPHAVIGYDDQEVARGELPSLMPAGLGCLSLQVGHNSPSPVSPEYEAPARFTGRLHDVVIEFLEPVPLPTEAQWRAAIARE